MLQPDVMSSIFDENPSVDGPDYVALVIEWDEIADDLERRLHQPPQPISHWPRTLKIAAGVLAVGVLWRLIRR